MKKLFKISLCLVLMVMLCASLFSINTFAAANTTIAFSVSNPKVGDAVTVTVKLNAGEPIYSIDGTVTYDSSVLKYVSGASSASGSTLKLIESPTGETSVSYKLQFTAIKEGTSNIAFSVKYVGASLAMVSATGSSANLVVKNPTTQTSSKPTTNTTTSKPSSGSTTKSSDATLSALSISGATLSPEFSKNVTEYSATVENSVANVTVAATANHKKATVSGAGEVALEIGENTIAVTVTAENGAKKTYNVKVKRATVEETVALNPLATVIGGKMHHINPDLSQVGIPSGFTLETAAYNGVEVQVFKSTDSTLTLYQIVRDEDKYADYYTYIDYRDEFKKLDYMTVGSEMYIFTALPEGFAVPSGYFEMSATLGGSAVPVFCSESELLKDFYVVYCFANGQYGFYSFDTLQTTIQRAPNFGVTAPQKQLSIVQRLLSLSIFEKALALATLVLLAAVITLTILLIVSCTRSRKYNQIKSPLADDDISAYFTTFKANEDREKANRE